MADGKRPRIQMRVARGSDHPWIFSRMVRHPKRRPPPGAIVEVEAKDGTFLGRGFYHPTQTIAVRLLTQDPGEEVDGAFFERLVRAAKSLREDVLRIPEETDAYRLLHAEGDGLSGVVVDRFADVFVVEPFCAGGAVAGEDIAAAVATVFPGARVAFRVARRTEDREGADFSALKARYPLPGPVEIRERGVRMKVDFSSIHKTGYFLDQRENRATVAQLARGRSVYDLFCYTGGFGIHAAAGGAARVVSVDLDEKALETAAANARLNGVEKAVVFEHRDVFDFLRARIAAGEGAEVVVVDPAKLAGVKDEMSRALKTYADLNRLAVQAVEPGGILVTCSCSGLVSEERFRSVVTRAAADGGAELQIFRTTGPSPDHPVSSRFPEGRYLKVIWARVRR